MKRISMALAFVYAVCVLFGTFGKPGYVGAIGRAPFALAGHKSSIIYLYDCFSFENYNHYLSNYWEYRGALAEIPEFQRLYGEKLLSQNNSEGLIFLTKAAENGDFNASAILARLYADVDSRFQNRVLASQYSDLAKKLQRPGKKR